ncbi:MAG: SGNH/GDSL hydrolase family protein [Planctomycetes bacterium]|nr:SGNH/GDSL hydrolase family protein [Planctomycetota bacterium]
MKTASVVRRAVLLILSEIAVVAVLGFFVEGLSRGALHAGLVPESELRFPAPLIVRPHPFIGFSLRELAIRGAGQPFEHHINRQGYRGALFTAKTPQTFRVLCVGDSVVYGDNLADGETLPFRLEESLKEIVKTKNIEVINAGVLQYTSAETFAALALRGIDTSPDVVVFYQGANDVAPRLVRPFKSDYSHFRSVWVRDSEQRADKFLEASDGYVTLRWLAGVYPNAMHIDYYTTRPLAKSTQKERESGFFRSGNDAFLHNEAAGTALARAAGARSLIVATSYNEQFPDNAGFLKQMIEQNRRKQSQTAAKQGANFYELPPEFASEPRNFRDNVHFTADGAKTAAAHIAYEMARLNWLPK